MTARRSSRLFHYHAFGLRIASQIELPELHPGSGPPDAVIHYCEAVPARGFAVEEDVPWLEGTSNEIVINLGGFRFVVRDGRAIDVEAPPGSAGIDVRLWLLGSVMAALLHQRGYLSVHANVIALKPKSAAAFAGESGAGKSSLAAWFEARGHRVLADDVCALRVAGDGTPSTYDGIPRVKLWADALSALGRTSHGLERVATNLDKYHVALARSREEGSLEPLILERVYLLDRAAPDEALAITRLTGAEAAYGVVENAYRWSMGELIKPRHTQFEQCLALARHAAVFRVKRRWGMESFEEDALAIERHLAAPL